MPKEKKVCTMCGGDNILADAWARWDIEEQEYVLDNTFDDRFCEDCDCACGIEWVAVDDSENSPA